MTTRSAVSRSPTTSTRRWSPGAAEKARNCRGSPVAAESPRSPTSWRSSCSSRSISPAMDSSRESTTGMLIAHPLEEPVVVRLRPQLGQPAADGGELAVDRLGLLLDAAVEVAAVARPRSGSRPGPPGRRRRTRVPRGAAAAADAAALAARWSAACRRRLSGDLVEAVGDRAETGPVGAAPLLAEPLGVAALPPRSTGSRRRSHRGPTAATRPVPDDAARASSSSWTSSAPSCATGRTVRRLPRRLSSGDHSPSFLHRPADVPRDEGRYAGEVALVGGLAAGRDRDDDEARSLGRGRRRRS